MSEIENKAAQLFSDLKSSENIQKNSWKVKQNNELDTRTKFIYETQSLYELRLMAETLKLNELELAYAEHRWRNFKRHDAWLMILCLKWSDVIPSANPRDPNKDFSMEVLSYRLDFDLKVTRMPKSIPQSLSDRELVIWMYRNQSKESRFHLRNRLFVIAKNELDLYEFEKAKSAVDSFRELRNSKLLRITFDPSNEHAYSMVIRI
jgi:hypothetical protein